MVNCKNNLQTTDDFKFIPHILLHLQSFVVAIVPEISVKILDAVTKIEISKHQHFSHICPLENLKSIQLESGLIEVGGLCS